MTVAHAVTMNGRITTELKPRPGRSIEEELRTRLALLDGAERFALWLWRLPDGVPFDRVDLESWPTELIQCAGGVEDRFTCEIRRLDPEGHTRHEVIGRRSPGDPASVMRTESVRWAEHTASVQENEVLDLDAVSELFESYLVTGEIAVGFETRPLVRG